MRDEQFRKNRIKILVEEASEYTLGGFIKHARLILGYKRKDVIHCIERSNQLLCQIEHERHITNLETYLALADFYGIPRNVIADKVNEELDRKHEQKLISAPRKPYLRKKHPIPGISE